MEVNNKKADLETKVYDKFSFAIVGEGEPEAIEEAEETEDNESDEALEQQDVSETVAMQENPVENVKEESASREITVIVNQSPVVLSGRLNYIFVDVFDFIDFDLSQSNGRYIATRLNGNPAQ